MAIKQIYDLIAAKALPNDGRIVDGGWFVEGCCDCDVVVAAGSRATLIITDDNSSADINIDVECGAELRVLHLVTKYSSMNIAVAVAQDAQCKMTQVVVSPSDTRVVASLMERGAEFDLGGVFLLAGEDKASVTVDVNHMASDCRSNSRVKGVAMGKAHGSFAGLVYVAPDAQRTDSVQSSRNITVGEARIETLPQLEIYADDVKCSHGATVGQMDSDAILYMRQRGLTTAQAKRLQIEGFVQDVAMHCAIEELSEELMEAISVKLNTL
jgi:Fe-S cluster assembly protein SufD